MSKELVELKKGLNSWALNYYDRKGEKHNIAVFSCGNLQISLMISAARQLVKRKMLDGFIIEAEQDAMDHLQRIIPDLTKIGTDEDGYPKVAA